MSRGCGAYLAPHRGWRYPCRCRRKACEARQSLARHPDEYARPKRCAHCRCGTLRVDGYRDRVERTRNHAETCRCDRYSFPHHKGRGYCRHNTALTPNDLREREELRRWA